MKSKVIIQFGRKVRQYREEINITQEQLAERAELHRTYVGMIERAEKNITLVNMEKIARALQKTLKDFF